MKWIITISSVPVGLLLLDFTQKLPDVPDVKSVKKSAVAINAGRVVYASKCQTCHDNTEIDMRKNTYARMMPMLASMVDMEKLNKKEIEHVAAYVYAVSKK